MIETVSVITPMYQSGAHIEKCIQSVISQNHPGIEHIIIDNNSTDLGPEIAASYAREYPHIRLLRNETPGSGPTRNVGIREAKGRYIAFLDADDWWHPEKIKRQITAMKDSKAVFSWTGYEVVDENDRPVRYQAAHQELTVKKYIMKLGVIGCLTAVYDQKLLGKMFMNDMKMRQDFCLWHDILKRAEGMNLPVIGINESLATYRSHSKSLSADKKKASKMQWRALRDHVGLGLPEAAICFSSYAIMAIFERVRPR